MQVKRNVKMASKKNIELLTILSLIEILTLLAFALFGKHSDNLYLATLILVIPPSMALGSCLLALRNISQGLITGYKIVNDMEKHD